MRKTIMLCDICGAEIDAKDDYAYFGIPEKSDRKDLRERFPCRIDVVYRDATDQKDLCIRCAMKLQYILVGGLNVAPDEFAKEMRRLREVHDDDSETMHSRMDDLMATVLVDLGYGEGVDIFESVEKYYS